MHTAEPPPIGRVFTTTALEPPTGPHGPKNQDFGLKKIQSEAESAKFIHLLPSFESPDEFFGIKVIAVDFFRSDQRCYYRRYYSVEFAVVFRRHVFSPKNAMI